MIPHDEKKAQARFPRGLKQPEKGYRFSMDPLLLACFVRQGEGEGVDLGSGCGVLSLALMLRFPGLSMAGLELDPSLARMSEDNAGLLGLSARFRSVIGDVGAVRELTAPESVDLVAANPPFREPWRGRVNPDTSRATARFEPSVGLEGFLKAGAFALKNRKPLYVVFPAERLAGLVAELCRCRLEPKRLRMVHSRAHEPARLVLVEARKNGGMGLLAEEPLILYQGAGQESRLTEQALDFCPYIRCNSRRNASWPSGGESPESGANMR